MVSLNVDVILAIGTISTTRCEAGVRHHSDCDGKRRRSIGEVIFVLERSLPNGSPAFAITIGMVADAASAERVVLEFNCQDHIHVEADQFSRKLATIANLGSTLYSCLQSSPPLAHQSKSTKSSI